MNNVNDVVQESLWIILHNDLTPCSGIFIISFEFLLCAVKCIMATSYTNTCLLVSSFKLPLTFQVASRVPKQEFPKVTYS